MGKPFEISYTPEKFDTLTGGDMPGPYGGINVVQPENVMRPEYSPSFDDVIIRNQELRSRPNFLPTFLAGPDANMIVGIAPGFGANASGPTGGIHTIRLIAWTVSPPGGMYRWDGAAWKVITNGANPVFSGGRTPMSWRIFQNQLYFTDASDHTYVWNGVSDTSVADAATITGGTIFIGGQFVDELDNHLLVGNTNENGVQTPWRLRWSANGLPLVWDPTVNVNAGLADFLEVPDQITGSIMMGRVGYIVRSNGVTEISPTGNGVAPFDFNHLWASQVGIGNILPYSIGLYGPAAAFVAADNIYGISAYSFNPIGGLARDAIMADLGNQAATDNTNGPAVIGFITPFLVGINATSDQVSTVPSLPFYTYMLFVRTKNPDSNTRMWIYHMEDKNWSRWTLPNAWVTAKPAIALPGAFNGGATMMVPIWNPTNSTSSIGMFDTGNFNDANQPSTYNYRIEDVEVNRYPTVRRVILTYRDIGQATITVTLTGNNDNGTVVSNSASVNIGNAIPTDVLITKFVDITLSAFRPQLSWSRAANGGPVAITRATILGESEEVTL